MKLLWQGLKSPYFYFDWKNHSNFFLANCNIQPNFYSLRPVLFLPGLLFGGIMVCCLWFVFRRNRHSCGGFTLSCFCCGGVQRDTEVDSAGSLYPPPRYSRCGSFPQAPPPYSEVISLDVLLLDFLSSRSFVLYFQFVLLYPVLRMILI